MQQARLGAPYRCTALLLARLCQARRGEVLEGGQRLAHGRWRGPERRPGGSSHLSKGEVSFQSPGAGELGG
jgi:hypothetical protein